MGVRAGNLLQGGARGRLIVVGVEMRMMWPLMGRQIVDWEWENELGRER
jgi:hypothetical protein